MIESNDGSLIVVDGGLKTNAPYLAKYIKGKGGKVAAWLLTHPHEDHVGALAVILEQQKLEGHPEYYNIDPGQIYYGFAPLAFYEQYEPAHRIPMMKEIMEDLAQYDSAKRHESSPAGTNFYLRKCSSGSFEYPILHSYRQRKQQFRLLYDYH